jgi:hypothetical protein
MSEDAQGKASFGREIRSALPGTHEHSHFSEPENPNMTVHEIATGFRSGEPLLRKRDYFFGILSWVVWVSWGIYLWWFSDTVLFEYIFGVLVWLVVFIFSVVGVPLVRRTSRNRMQK